MTVEVPTKWGGTGASFTAVALVIEEMARVDPSTAIFVDVQNTIVSNIFLKHASEALKEKWLPRLCKKDVGVFCLSETTSGSDAFALKTTAKPDGPGKYILNGEKMWITNARESDVLLVFANVDPSKGHRGITLFVVERNAPGVKVGKPESKVCIRASSTCPISFNNVQLTSDDVIGEVGQGYKYAILTLNEGRIGIGAQMIGLARGALDIAVPYTRQRIQFGKPISEFQAMQHQLSKVATEIEAARLLVYNAARLKEEGKPFIKEAAMAKYYSSQVAALASKKSIEWMGGVGITTDVMVEKFYRDSIIGSIYEGTSNIQLSTIAKYL